MAKRDEVLLAEIERYYGADARNKLQSNPQALKELSKGLENLELNDPVKSVSDSQKLNQMLLGVVNPGQTGGYETSPILRIAALYQGNQNAIPEQNPYINSSPLEVLDPQVAKKPWPPRPTPPGSKNS
jgi:hypothetical protein